MHWLQYEVCKTSVCAEHAVLMLKMLLSCHQSENQGAIRQIQPEYPIEITIQEHGSTNFECRFQMQQYFVQFHVIAVFFSFFFLRTLILLWVWRQLFWFGSLFYPELKYCTLTFLIFCYVLFLFFTWDPVLPSLFYLFFKGCAGSGLLLFLLLPVISLIFCWETVSAFYIVA